MARLPRLLLAGYPLHVIVRGHNRQNVFLNDLDRQIWLQWLRDAAREHDVDVHAYVLMSNHVHLLVTPKTVEGLGRTMQSVGRRYTQRFNKINERSGTLWEGRYKSTVIDSERYLMVCSAYIELNPVRAGIVAQPEDYRWSSYRHHAGLESQPWLSDHPLFWALGNTPFERQSAWRVLVQEGVGQRQSAEITEATLKGWALGAPGFSESLEQAGTRRPLPRPRGRPVGSTKTREVESQDSGAP